MNLDKEEVKLIVKVYFSVSSLGSALTNGKNEELLDYLASHEHLNAYLNDFLRATNKDELLHCLLKCQNYTKGLLNFNMKTASVLSNSEEISARLKDVSDNLNLLRERINKKVD